MNIEGAIFDLDGTLLDSMFIWDTIGESYLRSRGIEPQENLNEKFKAMSLYQAACHYQSEYGLTDSADVIMDGVNDMVRHYYTDEVQPKAGVAAFLAELKQRDVNMCIATATDRPLAEAALSRCGLLSYFGEIFTCGSVGRGKDEPEIYRAAHRFLQTPKSGTWVFEDAYYAVRTAKAAGFPVVGVYDPSAGHAEEIRALADLYIRSFEEMEDILHEKSSHDRRL
jgi:HAD superfamily hydrolase (TIGR01509 family)